MRFYKGIFYTNVIARHPCPVRAEQDTGSADILDSRGLL